MEKSVIGFCILGGFILAPVALQADPPPTCNVTVQNCATSTEKLVVRSYDGDDALPLIAADDVILDKGETGTLSCHHTSCRLAAEPLGAAGKPSDYYNYSCDTTAYIKAVKGTLHAPDAGGQNYHINFYSGSCP